MPSVPAAHLNTVQLADYIHARLDSETAAWAKAHLASCPSCREAAREAGFSDATLAGVDPAAGATSSEDEAFPAAMVNHPRYRVLSLLGVGGMGAVYKAEHRLMERPVALKVIHSRLIDRPESVDRFRREVQAVARLSHPNIVAAFDAERAGDTHFLAMEFVEGTDLARLVQERGPLPVAMACDCVRQAALGMQHAFERGMVHRDLKPHNLILTPEGVVKVLDLGLARFAREGDAPGGQTAEGVIVGTPDYMAPEQASDGRSADIRADIYSLGCTLYHLLTGQPPFPNGDSMRKLLAHQMETPRPVRELRPEVSQELAGLLDRMMAKKPDKRPQTPAEVANELRRIAEPAAPRRRRVALVAVVVVVAAGLAAGVALNFKPLSEAAVSERDDAAVSEKIAPAKSEVAARPEPEVPPGHLGFVDAIAVVQGGTKVVTAARDRSVLFRDLNTRRLVLPPMRHNTGAWRLAASPDGKLVAVGECVIAPAASPDADIRIWSLETGKEVRRFRGHPQVVYDVDWSRDGRRILSCGTDAIRHWDAVAGGEVQSFSLPKTEWTSAALSPDGRQALAGDMDGGLRLWDLKRGVVIRELAGHTHQVTGVAFTPDGQYAVSGSLDNTARLWDLQTGRQVRAFVGHQTGVYRLAVSPGGTRVVTTSGIVPKSTRGGTRIAGWDYRLRVFDLATGAERARLDLPWGAQSVAFTSEGEAVAPTVGSLIHVLPIPEGGAPTAPTQLPGTKVGWPIEQIRNGSIRAPIPKVPHVFRDNFENPASGFQIQKQEKGDELKAGYRDGHYVLATKTGYIYKQSTTMLLYSNFACEMVGRVQGPPGAKWALDLRNQPYGGTVNLAIDNQGSLWVGPGVSSTGKRGEPPLTRIPHAAIKPGYEYNTLFIVLRSRTLEVYVNGAAVCNPITLDVDVAPSLLKLGVAGEREIGGSPPKRAEFKSMTIWPAESLPTLTERGAKPLP